ncbi:MAG: glycosyltransferase [Aliishimia sp.]
MSQHRILIVVTHLLGSGHLSRALTLARAFVQEGHQVHVVSGGMPAKQLDATGVNLVQLPPLRSDGTDFTRLLAIDGTVAEPAFYEDRQSLLLKTLQDVRPDVIITELFPFGRRSLRAEFQALLEAATELAPRPRIFASIRDILAPPSKPRKITFADQLIARFYDGVLVHSDPKVVPLQLSWPVSDTLNSKLHYTGFVAPPLPKVTKPALGEGTILVSAGGGSVGDTLYKAALEAAQNDARRWHLLIGGHDANQRIDGMRKNASDNVILETARPDFREMLQCADASISLCGYNTAMDVLQTGLPAVMVAFDDGAEVEQSLRANALANLPRIETCALSDVTSSALKEALAQVIKDQRSRSTSFGFDGATQTVRICTETLS